MCVRAYLLAHASCVVCVGSLLDEGTAVGSLRWVAVLRDETGDDVKTCMGVF